MNTKDTGPVFAEASVLELVFEEFAIEDYNFNKYIRQLAA